jgi:hypothetical protein
MLSFLLRRWLMNLRRKLGAIVLISKAGAFLGHVICRLIVVLAVRVRRIFRSGSSLGNYRIICRTFRIRETDLTNRCVHVGALLLINGKHTQAVEGSLLVRRGQI